MSIPSTDQIFTPTNLAYKLVKKIEGCSLQHNFTCLEPSAGRGAIAYLVHRHYTENIWCCEMNKTNRAILGSNYKLTEETDFLEHEERYDLIIASPPFGRKLIVTHLKHMLTYANKAVITFFPLRMLFEQDKMYTTFWASLKKYSSVEIEYLPAGSFKSVGSDVEAGILVIKK